MWSIHKLKIHFLIKGKEQYKMMVQNAKQSDFESFLDLAEEVENIFGSMVNEKSFREGLKGAISNEVAFCIYSDFECNKRNTTNLKGGIVISKTTNEIVWLVVSKQYRGHGVGSLLVEHAINNLNPDKDIFVQTFDKISLQGEVARNLYLKLGFIEHANGGLNPAGVPTVIMCRSPDKTFVDPVNNSV